MTKKTKKKRSLKERIAITISVVLMVISVLAVAFVILYNTSLFQGKNGAVVNDSGLETSQTDTNGNPILGKGQVNFLVCGLDESESMTDIIMLVCVDMEKNTVNVLQIPRDTYVKDGTASTGKINSAYSSGDKSLTPINRLIKIVNEQYQIKVDHYVTITIDSFRNIVDAIGGVPIDMPYAVGNAQYGIIPEGYQVLDGEHAEWLVRHRHTYYDQDIGRMKIQRLFLASMLQQVKTIGVKEVTKLLPALYGEVTTDLSVADAMSFSNLAFSVNMDNVTMFIVPGEGLTYNGQSVWSMHLYETADMLNEHFRPYTADVPAEQLKIIELAHTGEYYENTQDSLDEILGGADPGQQKTDSTQPTYTHVITQKKPVTTTAAPVTTTVTVPATTTAVTSGTTTGSSASSTSQSENGGSFDGTSTDETTSTLD